MENEVMRTTEANNPTEAEHPAEAEHPTKAEHPGDEAHPMDKGCELDSMQCRLFGAEDCSCCPIYGLSEEKKAALYDEAEYLADTVPEGIYELEHSEKCLFCRDGSGTSEYNAVANLGHKRKRGCKEPIEGVASEKGFLLSVKLPICSNCKRTYSRLWYLPKFVGALVALCFLVVLSIGSVREALAGVHSALPLAAMLFGALTAVFVCLLLKRCLAASLTRRTRLSIFEIEGMEKLGKKGWKELTGKNSPASRLFFEKRVKPEADGE